MTSSIGNVASLAARGAGSVVRHVRAVVNPSAAHPAAAGHSASGWLVVTVFVEPSELDAAKLPAPLAEFGDRIEVRIQAAPGGKGTELAARLRDRPRPGGALSRLSGQDPEAGLRSALRRAKQLIEVGEVLAVDPVPHGERTATPGGAFLEGWTKAAPKGGVR
ncbi:hypothetical protein [Paractinoplanes lichenicola]|uniref:Uncharacterized protein n=1 Tax=Paractinoplanes lichenicola TaxID=2802976 RepID=A0ABS1W0K5_9ACTN|nr:hypothetical protein [Actinoplanes lichenicola]MBL7260271.1 hypothetical protein [Actinoplanes lichenicola]